MENGWENPKVGWEKLLLGDVAQWRFQRKP